MKIEYTKRRAVFVTIAVFLFFLTGCSSPDPLTKLLKDNKYSPIVPIPETQHVGDIYITSIVPDKPVLLMRDIFQKDENEKFMNTLKGRVVLPTRSGKKEYDVNVDVDVIGDVQAELSAYGVSKFRLKLGDTYQYVMSDDKFETELYPKLIEKRPNKNYSGKYIVTALLQVESIEYELLTKTGAKIAVKPGEDIEKIIKAKLSTEWKVNENSNLCVSKPCYIGYKVSRIAPASPEVLSAKEAKMKELDEAQAELLASIPVKKEKIEKLDEAQAELSAALLAKVARMEELQETQGEPSKANTEGFNEEQAELWASMLSEKAEIEVLRKEQVELSKSMLAEEANINKLRKEQAELSEPIVLEEVPMEEIRQAQTELKK